MMMPRMRRSCETRYRYLLTVYASISHIDHHASCETLSITPRCHRGCAKIGNK